MKARRHIHSLIRCSMLAALALGISATPAADLTIIELKNHTADEMLPVLLPLVEHDTALSGVDYKLFVRGNANDVARIRQALAVLDRAPRQLIVSVRYNHNPQDKSTDISVGGKIIHSGSGPKIDAHAGTSISTGTDASISSVRVLEGNGAHIASGQSMPLVTAARWSSTANNQGAINGVAIDYHESTSGFDVVPHVSGDRVVLDIAIQQERATNDGQASGAIQRATTTLAGRLGEWLELGGVTASGNEQNSTNSVGRGAHIVNTQNDRQTIEVKIEEAE